MRCLNCGKKIPDDAKVCGFCEAKVGGGITEEERQIVEDILLQMPPEAMEDLRAALAGSDTAEDFANRIIVGDCPKCGSVETGDCENDPEIGELLVGRCYQCGQLWCIECRKLLEPAAPECECWNEEIDFDDDFADLEDEFADDLDPDDDSDDDLGDDSKFDD